ncbi:MAG: hypothetical protein PWP37_1125 [Thermotogota bacterium]|nr:hypothetical protein [Thermotogota bacterium]MDK2864933.1 hypothetical protein [Thermotogota bacterium]HCZ07278.1 hypothetical protein [Thermotogota bacterium]
MKRFFLVIILAFVTASIFAQETIHVKADLITLKEDLAFLSSEESPVWIQKGDLTVEAASATLYKRGNTWNRFVADGNVELNLEDLWATATHLEYDMDKETGSMNGEIRLKILQKDSTETVMVLCDSLTFDRKAEIYRGNATEKVRIEKGDLVARASSFVYERNKDLLTLEGDVYIEDSKNQRKVWASKAVINLQNDEITVYKAEIELRTE